MHPFQACNPMKGEPVLKWYGPFLFRVLTNEDTLYVGVAFVTNHGITKASLTYRSDLKINGQCYCLSPIKSTN